MKFEKILNKYKRWKMSIDEIVCIKTVRECPINNVNPDDYPDPDD